MLPVVSRLIPSLTEAFTVIFSTLPAFVVTTMTPFAPCEPKMAVDAASFSTVSVSMSEGFSTPGSSPTITPSITHRGEVLPLNVARPRICTAPFEPGWLEPGATYTPEILPFSMFSTLGVVMSASFSCFSVAIAPVRLSFFWTPYPTTTTSSSSCELSSSLMSYFVFPGTTLIVMVL